MNISGQHIAVLGAGRSGQAAQRLAQARGAVATLVDSGDPQKFSIPGVFGDAALAYDAPCDLAVVALALISNGRLLPSLWSGGSL